MRWSAWLPAAERRRDLVDAAPRAARRPPRGQRVRDEVAAGRRRSGRRRVPHGALHVNSVPASPWLTRSRSRRRRPSARARRCAPRAAVAAAMAATRGSSAFRTASPSGGSAAGSSALALRDALDAARRARDASGGPPARRRPPAARSRPAGRSRRPCTCSSRARPPRAPAPGGAGSSAGPVSELRLPSLRSVLRARATGRRP